MKEFQKFHKYIIQSQYYSDLDLLDLYMLTYNFIFNRFVKYMQIGEYEGALINFYKYSNFCPDDPENRSE